MSEDNESIDSAILEEKLQKIADLLFDLGLEEEDVDDVINDIYEKATGEEYETDEDDEEEEEENRDHKERENKERERERENKDKERKGEQENKSKQVVNSSQHQSSEQKQSSKSNELTSIISKATTRVNTHKQLDCILLSGGVQTQVYQHVLYCTSHNLDPVAIKKLISQKLKVRSAIKNDHLYLEGTHTRKDLEKFYVGTVHN
jgi:archaellum component FlaD/FlaE